MDGARLEVRDVSDDAVVADDCGVLGRGVHDRVVLNAGSCPDDDVAVVATQHCPRPDRRLRSDSDVANDHRVRVNERRRIN